MLKSQAGYILGTLPPKPTETYVAADTKISANWSSPFNLICNDASLLIRRSYTLNKLKTHYSF